MSPRSLDCSYWLGLQKGLRMSPNSAYSRLCLKEQLFGTMVSTLIINLIKSWNEYLRQLSLHKGAMVQDLLGISEDLKFKPR